MIIMKLRDELGQLFQYATEKLCKPAYKRKIHKESYFNLISNSHFYYE